ncbi:MAG: transporter substrate-binding domain-containing protein [Alteromonadaceae bacterium]|nr:transporter substrate-binding domain-containing protein [Alteromonadaceae bacterium]
MRIIFVNFFILLLSFSLSAQQLLPLRIVGTNLNLLQYKQNNQIRGTSVDIMNQVLKRSQLEAKIELMPWARAYYLAKNRPNMIILSMIRTPEREPYFYWLGIVSKVNKAYISLQRYPQNFAENDQQAKQKTVVVVRNSAAHKILLKKGFIEGKNLFLVASPKKAFNLFVTHKVDLMYTDPAMVKDYINEYQQGVLEISYSPIDINKQQTSYIAININSTPQLVSRLRQAMKKFAKTPEYKSLLD